MCGIFKTVDFEVQLGLTIWYIVNEKSPLRMLASLRGIFIKLNFAVVNLGLVIERNQAIFLGSVE